jgi:hydroxyacylglutathione hydrolase
MLIRRLYDHQLAQASWLVGCAETGEAIVIDPNRRIERYVDAAAEEGLRVTHVTETHIHADFVSGSRELAERTGAELLLSREGGPDWQYGYADEAKATLLADGDGFMVGRVRFEARHTPGHTPEHLSFLVTDTATGDAPLGVFTGDFIFVGDVGRPDLLERAAHASGTMEASARDLYRSLLRFRLLPDYLQLWPGHGAGSACGKALGELPQTTLGYERLTNWAFAIEDEATFVREVLAGQPEPPRYFAAMKRINRDGPRRRTPGLPPELDAAALAALLRSAAVVVDLRPAARFAERHVPGTMSLPDGRSLLNWAGWLLPYDRDIHLLGVERARLADVLESLALIGLDRVAGWLPPEAIDGWAAGGGSLASVPQWTPAELVEARRSGNGAVQVVDVRWPGEWSEGHIGGAAHVPVPDLAVRLAELPADATLVMHCQGGGRSGIAASIAEAAGRKVVNLAGGFGAWVAAGLPTENGRAE